MTEPTRESKLIAPTRATHNTWLATDPVIYEGVFCITTDRLYTGSVEYLIGDGVNTYSQLKKFGLEADSKNAANGIAGLDANGKVSIANLPVVGTMGSAIIEQGYNSNGRYIKLTDGTMICYNYQLATTPPSANTAYSITWIFPAAFVDAGSAVSVIGDGNQPQNEWFSVNNIATDSALIRYYKALTAGIYLRLIAIGRWK